MSEVNKDHVDPLDSQVNWACLVNQDAQAQSGLVESVGQLAQLGLQVLLDQQDQKVNVVTEDLLVQQEKLELEVLLDVMVCI